MPALICGERFGNVTRTSWWLSECAATGIAAGQCNVKGPDSRRLVVPGGDRCWVGGGTERWDGDEGLWRPSCSALLCSAPVHCSQLNPAQLIRAQQSALPFSSVLWILSRVFLMRRAVRRAEGFWYQHSFISFTSADNVYETEKGKETGELRQIRTERHWTGRKV